MRPGDPLLSAVVLSWNRRSDLERTLEHVCREVSSLRGEGDFARGEIVVVDNGSTDGSAGMVRARFPEVRVLALPANVGIEGLNAGLRAARGEILVLLDDDSYPLPGALGALVDAFRRDPGLGVAACRIDGPPGWWEAKWPWHRVEPGAEVPTFIGCGAGIRRAALERAGYFDAAFFLYQNELDLAARIVDAGYTVRYLPESRFVHAVSASNRTGLREEYYGLRNLLWIIWKDFPPAEAVWLALRVMAARAAYCVRRGDLRRLWAAARSVAAAAVRVGGIARRPLSRRARQTVRAYLDLWFPPLIPWARSRLRPLPWLGR